MTASEKISNKIFQEQVRLLYANAKIMIITSVMAGFLLCWSLKSIIHQDFIVAWFSLFFTIAIARFFLLFLYENRTAEPDNSTLWYRRFLIGTYATATLWGAASFLLFPEHSMSQQIVFFMIVVGGAVAGLSSLCPSLPAVAGFLTLLLIPLTVRMVTLGTEDALFKGALVLFFLAVTLVGAVRMSSNLRENIKLRLQSIDREKNLKVSEQRYRHFFRSAPLGIFHYDAAGVIIDCNEEIIRILGSSRQALIGFKMLDRLEEQEIISAIKNSLTIGEGYYEGNYKAVTGDTITPVRAFFKAINSLDETPVGGVAIVEDFTERKQSEQLIQNYAFFDVLTGLPNRRLLLERLDNEISRARRHGHYGALLFLDLDNFKTINDSLGHSVGDEVLKIVAKRITECIRQEDTAARMGGDEFIIIITELDKSVGLAAHKVRGIAEGLSLCLSAPCQIEGQNLQITPSVGVSLFPKEDKGVDDILKQADAAMYRAKAAGRNEIHFFLPSMQEAADERLRLTTEIRKALDENQFALYYQPQVDLKGTLVGAEALLRWFHPERGMIPPGTFLEIAEETGLVRNIGQWVLQEACKQIKIWTDAGRLGDSQTISINISGKEIAVPDFVDKVISVLDETGADPNHLGIELTEGSLISTGKDIVQKIMALRQMGIKFSVDDFGTGYSSLSYLQSLPLNTLKIDRSFVNVIKDTLHDVVLVDTIIMLAHNLGLEIIAEGVETEQELRYLNTRGCVVFQGFYFSKPVAVPTFTEMLKLGSSHLPAKGSLEFIKR
ncbi:MAG: EAL domain-containing protein [Desulfobulbaceae bacterium]|nr:EAL domain-containing protein [Desulfobulbaceae bacterium]